MDQFNSSNGQPLSVDPGVKPVREQDLLPPILLHYWQVAIRRKWAIAAIVLLALVGAVITTLAMPSLYSASTQLEISREQKQIANVEGVQSAEAGRDVEFYATQYKLLEARPVAERIARDLRLASNAEFFAAHGMSIDEVDPNSSPRERRAQREKVAVDLLQSNVAIEPIRLSRLVGINYTSRDPDMSARIANAWARAFIALSMDREFASTAEARRFLEERLGTLRTRLEQSERDAVNYAADRGIVTLGQTRDAEGRTQGSSTLVESNVDMLNNALNDAIAKRVEAQSRLAGRGDLTSLAMSSSTVSNLRQQRAALQSQYQNLLTKFEPNYPDAVALQSQIRSLDRDIAAEISRISGTRQSEFQEAQAAENQLRSQLNAARAELAEQERAGIQYNIYQRDADTNRQLYDALLQRYKEIGVAGTIGASNISIVEPAQIPVAPSSPNLLLNLAIGLLAGLVLASGVAILLEQLDEGIRNPADVSNKIGLPLLGNTPSLEDASDTVDQLLDRKSHLYEAYFSIRSNLAFATPHGFPRSLSVTSTRPGEGKTSTALALAIVLGRTGKTVLLIDADMRSPSINEVSEIPNGPGTSNFLSGDNDLASLAVDSRFENVKVMTAGPMPPNAAELLSGDRLELLVERGLAEFDHVVIDSPPILGLSDAPLISRAVEGMIMVVQSEGVPLRGIRASIGRMLQVGAHMYGVVLTKVEQRQGGYGYGYGYGYGGARYGEDESPNAA